MSMLEEQTVKVINDDIEIIARDVDEEVLNIQSMLEDKTEEQTVKVINDDIEIIAIEMLMKPLMIHPAPRMKLILL